MMNRYVACISLCLFWLAANAVAAPPRFSGARDVLTTENPAVTSPESESDVLARQGEAASPPPSANSNTRATADTKAPTANTPVASTEEKAAPPAKKKSESWLSKFFRKRKPVVPERTTRKEMDALVTTEDHHEEVFELLRQADLHRFEAGYEDTWHVQASTVMCSLTQQVPQYGRVEFRQGVGQPLEFAMYVTNPPAGSGTVRVSSEPPRWQHYAHDKDLGVLELENSDRAFTASAEWSRRLMIELGEGMQPVFRYWDAADASEDMEILLSAIRFREGLDLFNRCLGQLLRYDFKQVEMNVVHFHPDSSKLRKQTIEQLEEILESLKVDKSITQVNLEIYTQRDGLERYNFRLATRRAQAVRDYFIKHGIKEDMLYIKIHTKSKAQLSQLGYKDSDVYVSLQR